MQFPPTPPDEKTQQPGYATPPNAFSPLTPDLTPRKMAKSTSTASGQQEESRGAHPPFHTQGVTTSHGDDETYIDNEGNTKDGAAAEPRIPDDEMNTTKHMQGTASLQTQRQSPVLQPQQLRIRKKRAQLSGRDITHSPSGTMAGNTSSDTEWSGTPQTNVTTDRLYKQIRHSKMDRLEAIDDGTAIEAMILPAEPPRIPSLRHVKKRHSLRVGSADTTTQPGALDKGERNSHDLVTVKPRASAITERRLVSAPLERTPGIAARRLRHERRPLSSDGPPLTSSSAEEKRHVSLPIKSKEHNLDNAPHNLRRVLKESRIENPRRDTPDSTRLAPYETASSVAYPGLSPSIRSHRFANTQTPMSGISDRTDMELCEAKNVTLFTHSNDSVLLINHASKKGQTQQHMQRVLQPLSYALEDPESSTSTSSNSLTESMSTPEIQVNGNIHTMDSPLTNPRAAPLPPAIQFIPPTPSIDDERQTRTQNEVVPQAGLQRSGSLLRTARRLSDTILTPLFSRSNSHKYISRPQHIVAAENDRLHPMWMPNSMWHDDNDDDDYTSDEDYDDDRDRLPAGGDTSDHPIQQPRSMFPRKMSVRMPGFRGHGGFLQGNSLGVERHGSNKRRHHVDVPAQRQSTGVGFLQSVKRHVKGFGAAREEAAREKRRAALKDSIALRVPNDV